MQQKTTVRYRSEFVAKARKIKSDRFRHFIGAVTKVPANDPTIDYGIFIENMLDAAA